MERRPSPRDRSAGPGGDRYRSSDGPPPPSGAPGPPPTGRNFRGSPERGGGPGGQRRGGGPGEYAGHPPGQQPPPQLLQEGMEPGELRPERLMRSHKHMDAELYDGSHGRKPGPSPSSSSPRMSEHDYSGGGPEQQYQQQPRQHNQNLDPSSAVAKNTRNRRKIESMLRNDSLSSDPSDCVRPPPPKPHKHKRERKQRQQSLSSSDDEIQTTPECMSCDEIESESVSEKGRQSSNLYLFYLSKKFCTGPIVYSLFYL